MARSRRWTALGIPVAMLMVFAALAVAVSAPRVVAQENGDGPHPAHIHAGSCDELGDIVEPLNNVTSIGEGEVEGAESALPVKVSETEIELPLADILAAPHAVNIHESEENIQNYIACGDIGGRLADGRLVIGLQEINGSDHSGVAVLEEDDDDETDISVYLVEEGAVAAEEPAAREAEDEATPTTEAEEPAADDGEADEATAEADETEVPVIEAEETVQAQEEETAEAAAEQPAGEEVAVDIVDFSYDPAEIEIAVGDTVTWTNQDGVPHTVTAGDRDVLQSGAIAPGDSFRQRFEGVGEFEYFCEFYPDMLGTIVVE